VNLSLAVLTFK
jgi:hydroxymethylglutaryl-CoA synthase